jgi:Caspase domain
MYNAHKQVTAVAVFLCLLFFKPENSAAQCYYTLQVKHPTSSVVYNCFLRMEADGNNTMRIAYKTDSTKNFLAEVVLTDSITEDNKYFLVPRFTPRFIQTAIDTNFFLPVISFEKHSDSVLVYYEPVGITLTQEHKPPQEGIVLSILQHSFVDLAKNKAMVLEFYKINDPFFVFLSQNTTRSLLPDERKRKFYLIVIANTNDPTIGKSSIKDVAGITELFAALTKETGIGFVPIVVAGDAFNLANAKKVLDTIKPDASDILFFYYSGHGFRFDTDQSKYPRISFRTNNLQIREENNLAIEDVYNTLLKKRARLTIVISDCCNEKIETQVPFGVSLLRPRGDGPDKLKLNYDNFRKLFLPAQNTSIIIGSASPSQLAVGNPEMGGFFTNFFNAELKQSLYTNTGKNTWVGISVNAAEKTRQQSLRAKCDNTPNVSGRCLQRAEFKVLPPL